MTSVNGTVLTSEVTDAALLNEAVNEVVYKGTKERPRDTVRADYSGTVMGSGNGATVASFALQFVGNPYKYGGTSLTNGADCIRIRSECICQIRNLASENRRCAGKMRQGRFVQ